MGIRTTALGFFHECLCFIDSSLNMSNKNMCELGDQTLIFEGRLNKRKRILAKEYFEKLGFRHISIDIHGKNGAYPIDLCEPITDKYWLGRFDILTNFGTSEHVENQYECWRNIHNLVKPQGFFIHIVPITPWEGLIKDKEQHCPYYYDTTFFVNLCTKNGYRWLVCEALPQLGGLGCCFKKVNDNEFKPTKQEIDSWVKVLSDWQ